MRTVFAVLLSSLAVLIALFVLVSEDRSTPDRPGLMQREKTSDAGDRLTQALMLRRQRLAASDLEKVRRAQEILKSDGIYAGPVDGKMSQSMHEAIRTFQQSHELDVTGNMDDNTARELGLQPEKLTSSGKLMRDVKSIHRGLPRFHCDSRGAAHRAGSSLRSLRSFHLADSANRPDSSRDISSTHESWKWLI